MKYTITNAYKKLQEKVINEIHYHECLQNLQEKVTNEIYYHECLQKNCKKRLQMKYTITNAYNQLQEKVTNEIHYHECLQKTARKGYK